MVGPRKKSPRLPAWPPFFHRCLLSTVPAPVPWRSLPGWGLGRYSGREVWARASAHLAGLKSP